MAIFKHIEARVIVNNKPLPEHDVSVDEVNPKDYSEWPDAPQLHKYIECVPNTTFMVDFKPLSGFQFGGSDSLSGAMYVDGSWVHEPLYCKKNRQKGNHRTICKGQLAYSNGITTVRKCKFAEIQFDVDSSTDRDGERSKAIAIGTIRLVLQRRTYSRDCEITNTVHQDLAPAKFSEKHLKGCGKDTFAELGAVETIDNTPFVEAKLFDKKPVAIFVFHYFTRDGLQKIGVLPRAQSPTPPEQKAINELTLEEARALLQRRKNDEAHQEEMAKHYKVQLARTQKELQEARKRGREDAQDKDEAEEGDDELQVVKKQKISAQIEVIELDD